MSVFVISILQSRSRPRTRARKSNARASIFSETTIDNFCFLPSFLLDPDPRTSPSSSVRDLNIVAAVDFHWAFRNESNGIPRISRGHSREHAIFLRTTSLTVRKSPEEGKKAEAERDREREESKA